MSRWVTRKVAAKLAGVGTTTINRWAVEGVIPPSAMQSVGRTGKRVRYDAAFFLASVPVPEAAHV